MRSHHPFFQKTKKRGFEPEGLLEMATTTNEPQDEGKREEAPAKTPALAANFQFCTWNTHLCEDHNISARNIVEQVKTLDLQGIALICFQEVTDTSSLETLLKPLGFMFVGRTKTKFLRDVREEYLSDHGLSGSKEVYTCLFVRGVQEDEFYAMKPSHRVDHHPQPFIDGVVMVPWRTGLIVALHLESGHSADYPRNRGGGDLARKKTVEEVLSFASEQSPRPLFVVLFGDFNYRQIKSVEEGPPDCEWLEDWQECPTGSTYSTPFDVASCSAPGT